MIADLLHMLAALVISALVNARGYSQLLCDALSLTSQVIFQFLQHKLDQNSYKANP